MLNILLRKQQQQQPPPQTQRNKHAKTKQKPKFMRYQLPIRPVKLPDNFKM